MKRRDALKVLGASAVAFSALGAYDDTLIINTKDIEIKDWDNLTDFEAKHLPEISIKDKDEKGFTLVEITVGQKNIIHPSEEKHWIYEIDLYADDKLVGKTSLEPMISRGFFSTRVDLQGVKKLTSTARCNLHGNFTCSVEL
ncbi:desulfoferrodoxin family protein [uncultured Campylobacter sp.]|uniref:desulfoferrodoxin family protein n=1 Tax=uncultured Campylobacter sp. TaxID=218934 RepID=UPI00262BC6DC|nr:desulfoferrodoxin family protein [uncultured Campylobacter sp.]